jgi:hypothetical protein
MDDRPKWEAWALVSNAHGPKLHGVFYLPAGDRPDPVDGDQYERCEWLDEERVFTVVVGEGFRDE